MLSEKGDANDGNEQEGTKKEVADVDPLSTNY